MFNTVEEAVAAGAEVMADMEEMAAKARKKAKIVREAVETVHNAGKIGRLENAGLSMEIEALTKSFEADLFAFHSKVTLRCQALGIDLPQARDGGGR